MGVESGLKDTFPSSEEPVIGGADKAWVVHLALHQTQRIGYAAEVWSRRALAAHVRKRRAIRAWPAQPNPPCKRFWPNSTPTA